jgi:hypothetical protein
LKTSKQRKERKIKKKKKQLTFSLAANGPTACSPALALGLRSGPLLLSSALATGWAGPAL